MTAGERGCLVNQEEQQESTVTWRSIEKEERQEKDFLEHGHMGDDVSFFPESRRLFLSNCRDTRETVSVSSVKCKCVVSSVYQLLQRSHFLHPLCCRSLFWSREILLVLVVPHEVDGTNTVSCHIQNRNPYTFGEKKSM